MPLPFLSTPSTAGSETLNFFEPFFFVFEGEDGSSFGVECFFTGPEALLPVPFCLRGDVHASAAAVCLLICGCDGFGPGSLIAGGANGEAAGADSRPPAWSAAPPSVQLPNDSHE